MEDNRKYLLLFKLIWKQSPWRLIHITMLTAIKVVICIGFIISLVFILSTINPFVYILVIAISVNACSIQFNLSQNDLFANFVPILSVSCIWLIGMANAVNSIEYALWTSSNDYLGSEFITNFKNAANELDKSNDIVFTAHMNIINGSSLDCISDTLPCKTQCSNNGRYCAIDMERDGIDVIQENLRSLCVWEYDKSGYNSCGTWQFNGGCNEHFETQIFNDLTGNMTFTECCAKCKELDCESFSFGKKGVLRENYCWIYNAVCTDSGDTDWNTFIPDPISWQFTNGCQEHFTAIIDQDKSGTMKLTDCYEECNRNSNCKSFLFGKQGVVRQNWCNTYSVVCTEGADPDWDMFIPIEQIEWDWWDYSDLWAKNCGVLADDKFSNFGEKCSYTQMNKLDATGGLAVFVENCIVSSGGYGYNDGMNTMLDGEIHLAKELSLNTFPMAFVNNISMDNIDCTPPVTTASCNVLASICNLFKDNTKPDVCYNTPNPTANPTSNPTTNPTPIPTKNPSQIPTNSPTLNPTTIPTLNPSTNPTNPPTKNPSINPTQHPSVNPSIHPSINPSIHPSMTPTANLVISTTNIAELNAVNVSSQTNNIDEFIFIFIIILSSIFIILLIISCIHSHYSYKNEWTICIKNECYKSDQYSFRVIYKLLLRISDLITDIALAYTITTHYMFVDDTELLLILSVSSIIFLSFPYIINLVYIAQVTKLDNIIIERPTIWFSKYMHILVLLTLITGDCFLSTKVISSNMFGLNLFNSGLNIVQFNSIQSIKIINIILENFPQSVIQAVYGYYNGITALIILSLLLTLLSSISNIFSWCITGNIDRKYRLFQYALKVALIADNSEGNTKQKELLQIIKYRGCTKILRNKLCLILGIEISKLQISCVDMNENGCNINMIQTIMKQNTISIHQLYENKYNEINKEIKKIYSLTWNIKTSLALFANDINTMDEAQSLLLSA